MDRAELNKLFRSIVKDKDAKQQLKLALVDPSKPITYKGRTYWIRPKIK